MVSGGNEIETFFTMVELIQRYGLAELYCEGMPKLGKYLTVFDTILYHKMQEMYFHF